MHGYTKITVEHIIDNRNISTDIWKLDIRQRDTLQMSKERMDLSITGAGTISSPCRTKYS